MTEANERPSGSPTPTVRDYPEETLCPSCGRFVGAYTRCPYCGCEHKLRMSIRFFRFFALAVSLGGLFLIWLAARGIQAPLVKVKDIGPMNSFAYLRVEGETERSDTYPDGGVSFVLNDGTGSIRVQAYSDTGKELAKMGRVPAPGDGVSAEGTIQFTEDRMKLLVNIPEKVVVTRAPRPSPAPSAAVEIAEITRKGMGREVEIVGQVTGVANIGKGTKIELTDPTGSIDVVIWDSLRGRVVGAEVRLKAGALLRIRGHVGEYRGKLQVVPKASGRVEKAAVGR